MNQDTLPCEDEIPQRYANKSQLKLMYCDGFQDGSGGVPMQSQEAIRRHQGDHAWEAYLLGYEAGTKRRLG